MDALTNQMLQFVVTPTADPTPAELEQAIRVISKQFPGIDPFLIIDGLFKKLQLIKQQPYQNLPVEHIPLRITEEIPPKYFDFHNFLKRMVAKSYYYLGYGYERFLHFMLKKHASFHIDKRIYKIFSEGMVLQVYRSLEKMLIRNGFRIKLKHKNTVKQLNEWILNAHPCLNVDNQILKRFIARRYDIKDVDFTPQDAKMLYEILQKKYDSFPNNPTNNEELQKMNECLKDIEAYSETVPELDFDQLLIDNNLEGISLEINSEENQEIGNPEQSQLHYQDCDANALNFDMDSTQICPF